jgi:hypothetical protein
VENPKISMKHKVQFSNINKTSKRNNIETQKKNIYKYQICPLKSKTF